MGKDDQPRGEKALEREDTIRDLEPHAGAGQPPEPISDQEMKAFAEKLHSWGEGLTEREQELLAAILTSASGAEDEVSGYLFGSGLWPVAITKVGSQVRPWAKKSTGTRKTGA